MAPEAPSMSQNHKPKQRSQTQHIAHDHQNKTPRQSHQSRPSEGRVSAAEMERLNERFRSRSTIDDDDRETTPRKASCRPEHHEPEPNREHLSLPPTPITPSRRSQLMTEKQFQARTQLRRRETDPESVAALQEYESQRVETLEIIRLPESLAEVKRRILEYKDGNWGFIAVVKHNGIRIVSGGKSDVELGDHSFLRVFWILRNTDTDEVRLRGKRFLNVGYFNPLIPRVKNEVCWYQEIQKDIPETEIDQSMFDVKIESVVRKRTIRLTNQPHPRLGSTQTTTTATNIDRSSSVTAEGDLVCRWKLQRIVRDVSRSSQRRVLELAVARLRHNETDVGSAAKDEVLLKEWRREQPPTKGPYTMADVFCGAGGASAAAKRAGLLVLHSVDSDEKACLIYTLNFPGVVCQHDDVAAYCQLKGDQYIDVAHVSAPCQFFSPMSAHTNSDQGMANSETNRAASFAIHQVVLKDRPRIFTSENTAGLWHHHPEDMYPILGQLTDLGYSVRFGVLNRANYGVPQSRDRLIVIASWYYSSFYPSLRLSKEMRMLTKAQPRPPPPTVPTTNSHPESPDFSTPQPPALGRIRRSNLTNTTGVLA